MPALSAGKAAPEVSLSDMRGKQFSLRDALQHGPVVLAFFKVTCPVCQYAMPFLERIYRAHRGKAQIVAVSQHPRKETQLFLREYDITMPVLLDVPEHYPASNAYHLTNVPTVFLIAPGGKIEVSSVGWERKDIERINRRVAEEASLPVPALFHRGESIVDSKPG
ncbi:MAG: TlpA family protein disulfide reductase [Acidobacteriia bacterium]|nr:TlpA family protein disulfide reductase [Terriglobia bacterium]